MNKNINILQSTDYFNNATYANDISHAINNEIKVSILSAVSSRQDELINLFREFDTHNENTLSSTASSLSAGQSEETAFRPSLLLKDTKTLNIKKSEKRINIQGEQRHNVPASNEWNNSVYVYNANNNKLFSPSNKRVNKLIKSYLNLNTIKKRKLSRVQIRFKRLSLNRILPSKAEIKHTNNEVTLNVYLYNRNKKLLLFKLKNLGEKLLNARKLSSKKRLNKRSMLTNRSKKQQNKAVVRKRKISLLNYYNYKVNKVNKNLIPFYLNMQKSKQGKSAVSCFLPLLSSKKKSQEKKIFKKRKNFYFFKLINNCNRYRLSHSLQNKSFEAYAQLPYNTFSFSADTNQFTGEIHTNSFANPLKKIVKVSSKKPVSEKVNYKKTRYLLMRKISSITKKSIEVMKKARTHRKLILKSFRWKTKNFRKYELKCYKNYLSKLYKKETLVLHYMQLLFINSNKLKTWFSLGIKSLLSRIYKKKVQLNFINMKYLHFNNDNFLESIKTKLKNRNNRLLKVLKKSITLVKTPSSKLHYSRYVDSVKNRKVNGLNLSMSEISRFVMDTLKHKIVNGVRVEAGGRLSRRLTASRSVFKIKYKGSIKNIDSSYKGISSAILRGCSKSNVQQATLVSKTRNGSFGLKGWISTY